MVNLFKFHFIYRRKNNLNVNSAFFVKYFHAMCRKTYYSDTSGNEDNSFRNHIR